jgi:hypothetical protein
MLQDTIMGVTLFGVIAAATGFFAMMLSGRQDEVMMMVSALQ